MGGRGFGSKERTWIMTNEIKMISAYHEAGHAVVAWRLGWEVHQIEIQQKNNEWVGLVSAIPCDNETDLNMATYYAAGSIAQLKAFPQSQTLFVDQSDQDRINYFAYKLISGPLLPPFGDPADLLLVAQFKDAAEQTADDLLNEFWDQTQLLAHALYKSTMLTGDQVVGILHNPQSVSGGDSEE